jgi:hypothetical protein
MKTQTIARPVAKLLNFEKENGFVMFELKSSVVDLVRLSIIIRGGIGGNTLLENETSPKEFVSAVEKKFSIRS